MIADTYLWQACADNRITYDLSFSRSVFPLELVTYAVTLALIVLVLVLARDVIKWFERG